MKLGLACAIVRGWVLTNARKNGKQEELDSLRIRLGYLEPETADHVALLPVEDKVAMALRLQQELLAKARRAQEVQADE